MASTPKTLVDSFQVPTGTAIKLYQSPVDGKGTYLDVLSAMNDNASAVTLTLYVVPSGSTLQPSYAHIKAKSVAPGATDLLPEVRGKFIDAGDAVWGISSIANALSLFASGRELT